MKSGRFEAAAAASTSSLPRPKTADLDNPLHAFGFEIDAISAKSVTGRLRVTELCCQPYKVLHGGVSALISEALGSIGANVACGFRRVAGVQLSINHHRAGQLGDLVLAQATPLHAGNTIQVWEVYLWRVNQSSSEAKELIASSRVTVLCNLPVPEDAMQAVQTLKNYSKL